MKKETDNDVIIKKKKIASYLGFMLATIAMFIAVIISISNESSTKETSAQGNNSIEGTKLVSMEFGKNINEVKNESVKNNTISENKVEENETKTIQNNIKENQVENKIKENDLVETNANIQEEKKVEKKESDSTTENSNVANVKFIKPVDGEIIKEFSMDSLIYSETLQEWITHRGIDIKAQKATVVKAVSDGKIESIKEDPRYGLSITINHNNGFKSIYSSLLSSEFVKEGEEVKQGQSIGTVGNSAVFESLDGMHLHFELMKDGKYVNPDIYIK